MTSIAFRTDLAIANAAAFAVTALGAVNWALPLGWFITVALELTVAANAFILPLLWVKHRPLSGLRATDVALVAFAGVGAYAILRSALGLTAVPWAAGTLLSHMVLMPLAIGVGYIALLAVVLIATDFVRSRGERLASRGG